jgi:predicted  nucleic acid-binding Zn-ribbon protein
MALKASPNDQAKLLELQALDTRIQQLDHRAKMLPQLAKIAGLESESTALRVETISATGVLEDTKTELGRIESDVAVVEARITRDTDRLQVSTSVKDVAGLESELAGLTRRRMELEELELGVMERVEALETASRELRTKHDGVQEMIAVVVAEKNEALGVITSERIDSAADRSMIASRLPEDLLALYERQRARYGQGASMLRGGVSEASGLKFNEFDMAAIRSAAPDDVVICPESSAILVRTGESGL